MDPRGAWNASRGTLARIGWLAAIVLIALGAAGLVTALDHRPDGGGRAELTWAEDRALAAPLEAIVSDLTPLARDFDALGTQGRAALVALVGADPKTLDASIASGQTLVTKIGTETTALRNRVAGLPGVGPDAASHIGGDLLARVTAVQRSLDSTNGIGSAWATLVAGSTSASRLAELLTLHDTTTGTAVRQGSQADYADAVKTLAQSDAILAQARALRDRIANTADVSTLSQWIDRNAAIDSALRRLYDILVDTKGVMTDDARGALAAVKAAQADLPPDTRALVVIMSDIARAGLNQAVIRIEESRGKLAEAIAALQHVPGASSSPAPGQTGEPAPSATPGGSRKPDATPAVTPPDA